ncbi:hypothetical protein CY34DRAFT_797846 [Suillus luteus UH-Slu-Lm8-n1]|uniref:Uncharacterized protein n=1 Tax=Suillus luteus UH-Slu-Lm8-n1 TaxID=930992 RepID=A0A0D0C1B9_9AGAM|nr:hypothetical protein CY34DRAFT_797846 [Suillus luteus UH-Slu-Lm8-n1]
MATFAVLFHQIMREGSATSVEEAHDSLISAPYVISELIVSCGCNLLKFLFQNPVLFLHIGVR